MDYMTLKEAREKWGVTTRWINYLCTAGRIPGAVKMGTVSFRTAPRGFYLSQYDVQVYGQHGSNRWRDIGRENRLYRRSGAMPSELGPGQWKGIHPGNCKSQRDTSNRAVSHFGCHQCLQPNWRGWSKHL